MVACQNPITGNAVAMGQATSSDPTIEISHAGAENLCSTALQMACHSSSTAINGTTSSKNPDASPTIAAKVIVATATAETVRTPMLFAPATQLGGIRQDSEAGPHDRE